MFARSVFFSLSLSLSLSGIYTNSNSDTVSLNFALQTCVNWTLDVDDFCHKLENFVQKLLTFLQ